MTISRRNLVKTAAAWGAGFAAGACLPVLTSPALGRRRKDIILIVADAMRGDKIGRTVRGTEVTPALNRLAEKSAFFTSAFATAPNTKPSVASIMTGHYPSYHGVEYGAFTVPPNIETMASYLAGKGYATLAIQTNPWLEGERDLERGLVRRVGFGFNEHFDVYRYEEIDWGSPRVHGLGLAYAPLEKVTASLRRLLEGATPIFETEAPLFVYVHLMDTHQPWLREEVTEFTGRFHDASLSAGRAPGKILRHDAEVIRKVLFAQHGESVPDGESRSAVEAINDEAAALLDSLVGALLAALTRKERERTVIFTADHGDEIYEHGKLGHGKNLYNSVLHVPLVISDSDLPARRLEMRVTNAAIFATIRECLGEVEPSDAVITSLMPYISGSASLHYPVFAAHEGTYKLILSDGNAAIEEKERLLLFDVEKDPGETAPLPSVPRTGEREGNQTESQRGGAAYELKKLLQFVESRRASDGVKTTLSTHRWQLMSAPAGAADMQGAPLDDISAERIEQLKALGYL